MSMFRRPSAPWSPAVFVCAILLAAVGAAALGCRTGDEPPTVAEPTVFSALATGWNKLSPGGDTVCSDGSAFHFFARPGDPAKLLVYFQGGGACWTGRTCDLDLDPTYRPTAIAELVEAQPGEPRPERAMKGIFDFTRVENPVADYSMVFVPYCSGDVHIGNRQSSYQAPPAQGHEAHQFTVQHRGYRNATAALEWTFDVFAAPTEVFVTGSSAGSIPSPFYAHLVQTRYPAARVTQLGDGAGGYRRGEGNDVPSEQWGAVAVLAAELPYFANMSASAFTFEHLYIATGLQHPRMTLAEYDAAEDEVQLGFLQLIGIPEGTGLLQQLDANRADIEARVDRFRSFTAGGETHTILGRDFFYTYRVGDTTFRDWFAALVNGEPVANVHCRDAAGCAEAETLGAVSADPG